MKYTISLILLVVCWSASCQKICVADSLSKKGLAYTNVAFFLKEKLVESNYCNENGVLIYDNIHFESIELSYIGYKTKRIQKEFLNDTIHLSQNPIVLKEVSITKSFKNEIITIGHIKNKKKARLSASKGFEIVVYIENPFNKPKTINSFLFKIKKEDKCKSAVRIHIYRKDKETLKPGEEITDIDVLQYIDDKTKQLFEVNLSQYNIEFPSDGAFVGIEWLGNLNNVSENSKSNNDSFNESYIEINDEINELLTFTRSKLNNPTWKNTLDYKNEFKNLIEYKNVPNASFGVKLFND